jgi:uncharacterized membrane protein YeaQ/YmgE (transglycosylase-associated protein family)
MSIIIYIIFGAIVGWIASMIAGRNGEQGAIGNIIVGILGAFLGSFIMNHFLDSAGVDGFNLRSFLVALMGAVILLFLFNAVSHRSRHAA